LDGLPPRVPTFAIELKGCRQKENLCNENIIDDFVLKVNLSAKSTFKLIRYAVSYFINVLLDVWIQQCSVVSEERTFDA